MWSSRYVPLTKSGAEPARACAPSTTKRPLPFPSTRDKQTLPLLWLRRKGGGRDHFYHADREPGLPRGGAAFWPHRAGMAVPERAARDLSGPAGSGCPHPGNQPGSPPVSTAAMLSQPPRARPGREYLPRPRPATPPPSSTLAWAIAPEGWLRPDRRHDGTRATPRRSCSSAGMVVQQPNTAACTTGSATG